MVYNAVVNYDQLVDVEVEPWNHKSQIAIKLTQDFHLYCRTEQNGDCDETETFVQKQNMEPRLELRQDHCDYGE